MAFILSAIIIIMIVVSSAQAEFVLNADCSSQIAEAFGREDMEQYMKDKGVKVKIHVFPSDVCINRLKNGYCNMAGSADKLSQDDRKNGLIEIPICKDPLVVITHSGNKVKNLSLTQIRDIFSGKTRSWNEVGGDNIPITLVIPSKRTDAYKNFIRQVMGPFEINNDLIADQAFTTVTCIRNIHGTVSFIANGIAVQYPDVNVIHVDGSGPQTDSYPFQQVFYLIIKGEAEPMMKDVIKYMVSDKALQLMKKRGITPLLK
jgi:phosphate transport system substrate-binding protein